MKEIIGIIPARWESTRFPGKPLHLIAGKPLLQHVWERANQAESLARLIIATDDLRVAEAAKKWGAEVELTSPTHSSGTDRVAEVAAKLDGADGIINIQGDEPLIEPALIERIASELQNGPEIEMITAAHPFAEAADAASPNQVKVVLGANGNALYFSRSAIPFYRDASNGSYLRHQGIYGYRRDLLLKFVRWKQTPLEHAESLEQLRALENGVTIHVLLTTHGSPGVDTPQDAQEIEKQLLAASNRSKPAAAK